MNWKRRRTRSIGAAAALWLISCSATPATQQESIYNQNARMVVVEGGLDGPATRGDWEEALSARHVRCGVQDVEHGDIGDMREDRVPEQGWRERQEDEAGRCGDDFETMMFRLANCEREARGVEPLRCDLRLVWAGRAHSADMGEREYFSHHSPEGQSPADRLQTRGLSFRVTGENIALAPTTAHVHAGWMTSDGHRESILSEEFTHTGVGVVRTELGYMMTSLFSADF